MVQLTLSQAFDLADIYNSDSDMERDLKFGHWIANRKYMIVSSEYQDVPNDVEILIIKDEKWKAITT